MKKGDIIKCFRGLYYHFGIYVGNNKVIHFSSPYGKETDASEADVIETSLMQFCNGDVAVVDHSMPACYTGEEVVRRAKSKLGSLKGKYNLLNNNCEHFANWCRCGESKSKQSDLAIMGLGFLALGFGVIFNGKRREPLLR